MAARRVNVVPHTHWDREWYSPFQKFRMRLVDMLDAFLPVLEGDPSYSHFLLDGQMAVVDDYLEVRPQAAPVLRRLAREGRLAMGPWYSLPDEFLVSGETIIRNLQAGIARAAEFGGAMDVGYLPDMFGHVSQMPQIFRLFGFEHAVVWRGVPKAIDRTAFMWSSPDGSAVRAEYLWRGYGNGAAISKDPKELIERVAAYEELTHKQMDGRNPTTPQPMLWMNGTDHQSPQPWLGQVVAEANLAQTDFDFVITTLHDHLSSGTTKGLPKWTGELRSGARANLLMGVTSNRTDVRIAAAHAERALERRAEPFSALFLPADKWPTELLHLAWKEMLRNAAHDSICACSHDEVVDAVLVRFQEARQIGEGLAFQALRELMKQCPSHGAVVVNPSARTRGGLIELTVPGEGPAPEAQIVHERPALRSEITFGPDQLSAALATIRSQRIDDETYFGAVQIDENDDALEITLKADTTLRDWLELDKIKADIAERVAKKPQRPITMRITQRPTRRIVCRVDDVPGFGWQRWTGETTSNVLPVRREGDALANGLLTIAVDPTTGSLTINGIEGFDRLVDSGDQGDTYNYSPPDHDVIVDTPINVEVTFVEEGPLRGRINVVRTYEWPESIDDVARARVGERRVDIHTRYDLHAGERMVRVHTEFDNAHRDHRLRALMPLPTAAKTSRADCAFAVRAGRWTDVGR